MTVNPTTGDGFYVTNGSGSGISWRHATKGLFMAQDEALWHEILPQYLEQCPI